MSNSNRWSTSSAPCRLEWRASRWLAAALLVLGVLGAFSVIRSDMPRVFSWPLAWSACLHALLLARRERHAPRCEWVWPGDGPATLDGVAVEGVSLRWRGALALLHWRGADGRIHRQAWWPDTLDRRSRRELRLAMERNSASRHAPRMAG